MKKELNIGLKYLLLNTLCSCKFISECYSPLYVLAGKGWIGRW